MSALRDLQTKFAAALFEDEIAPVVPYIREEGIPAAGRLSIYRNNLRESFIKTLGLEFPVIRKLVGAEYFQQLALRFHAAHPSRSGNLHHIGAPFAAFLRERFARTPYEYFAGVAELEWACQECLVEADAEPIDLERLRAVDPADYENLRFRLHPASRLVRSPYPIFQLWRANQEGAPDERIDLGSGGEQVLVYRGTTDIELHPLTPALCALLSALARGATLGVAFDEARIQDPSFDLGAALRRFVGLGVLTNYEVQP